MSVTNTNESNHSVEYEKNCNEILPENSKKVKKPKIWKYFFAEIFLNVCRCRLPEPYIQVKRYFWRVFRT